jgi:DNA repair photolyase
MDLDSTCVLMYHFALGETDRHAPVGDDEEDRMNEGSLPSPRGRGGTARPANRFENVVRVPDFADFEGDDEFLDELQRVPTEFLSDRSQSIVSENASPDIPFRYSLNPYRGCEHGCAYCYARPTHEYLGFNAGIDFESKIVVKERAPELFREWLARDDYRPEPIMFSGVTDCYQPAERRFQLTRQCLEVASEAGQPICIVTKNALVARDLDILQSMAERNLVQVGISLTSLDPGVTATMEPRTSRPAARLRAMQALSASGVPVLAMIAPVIPGVNDSEIPRLLEAAREHGATQAGYVLLRLPITVKPVFLDWLERTHPSKRERVLGLIQSTREGKLNSAEFGARMRGKGPLAEQIEQTFRVFRRKFGLDGPRRELSIDQFRPPQPRSAQLRLF